ncbi:hypothetical protein [Cellulomonas triticagri]|nr:hypothetical protein [Cellulomonas triticagri]
MSTTLKNTSRKKTWTAVGVGALAVAVAGAGAYSTLTTSIADNRFSAAVPEETDEPVEGALLVLEGKEIDKTFDSDTLNDWAVGDWTLTNRGASATEFDGTFQLHNDIDQALAEALKVQYAVVDDAGDVVRWRDAGTVAATGSLSEVLGIDSIAGESTIPVVVRVLLEDPQVLVGADETGAPLHVLADFTVSYLDPIERS